MTRFQFVVAVLAFSALACNLPGAGNVPLPPSKDQAVLVMHGVTVSPAEGNGKFTGTVVYTPGAFQEDIECKYKPNDTGVVDPEFVQTISVPADTTLTYKEVQSSFDFNVTQPGSYQLICAPAAVLSSAGYAWEETANFTVVAGPKFARLTLMFEEAVQTPDIDHILSTWCLYPKTFPPASPDDPGLIKLSPSGKLEGQCSIPENNTGIAPQHASLTGQFDQKTGAVTFELRITWDIPASGCHAEQVMNGNGYATSSDEATGSAEFSITATDGVGDYEPSGCYGDYDGPYWGGYTVNGTVPWVMEFTP